jgi:tRNA pseudouridine13 synthase
MQLPYLTTDFPGVKGRIKERAEDFFVQEIPLYDATGDGEHVLCEIQKVGMTTYDAIDYIAQRLKINPRDIGFAGLKDARAVSRQHLTIPHVTEEQVMAIGNDRLQPQWAAIHRNKLRIGHLAGNRFAIKIRGVEPTQVIQLRPVLDRICREGMPNYFGEQRFGRRGDNDLLGAAILRNDTREVLGLLLGRPNESLDSRAVLKARKLFDDRKLKESLAEWPRSSGIERRTLLRLIQTSSPGKAVRFIEPRLKKLWVSALQSRLFNEVVAGRISALGKLLPGDMAYLHANGACFSVEDVATEQPRADAWEISPTGPLLGYRMTHATADAGALEQAIFDKFKLTPADFKNSRDQSKGARRPLRVQPTDTTLAAGTDEHGSHITVAFTLPAGSFATVLLGELMKGTSEPEEVPEEDLEATDTEEQEDIDPGDFEAGDDE